MQLTDKKTAEMQKGSFHSQGQSGVSLSIRTAFFLLQKQPNIDLHLFVLISINVHFHSQTE